MSELEECVTIIHSPAAEDAALLLSQELQQAGLANRLVNGTTTRATEEVVLLVLLAIPVRTFLEALGASLGESAGSAFKQLAKKIIRIKHKDRLGGYIVLRNSRNAREYWISNDLPVEAYEQLIDDDSVAPGSFFYDTALYKWTE